MKKSILGLVMLGVIAALCVSVLVAALQSGGDAENAAIAKDVTPDVTVLVAARDLKGAQIIEANAVETQQAPQDATPEGYLVDPVQVVGRVLVAPMVKGQVLTRSSLASEGSGLELASALPKGMRAVAVSLRDSYGLHGLLYPGCIVDVLATTTIRASGKTVTKTLLEAIRVLAIEDKTIVSPKDENKDMVGRAYRSQGEMVTLMVDSEQAEALNAAKEAGSVSLALRHPLDTTTTERLEDPDPVALPVNTQPAQGTHLAQAKPARSSKPTSRNWEMTIIRNRELETKDFRLSAGH